jgi:hypothetical protein
LGGGGDDDSSNGDSSESIAGLPDGDDEDEDDDDDDEGEEEDDENADINDDDDDDASELSCVAVLDRSMGVLGDAVFVMDLIRAESTHAWLGLAKDHLDEYLDLHGHAASYEVRRWA